MITFVYRGTGIMVLFYLGMSALVTGWWFPKRTLYDAGYTAQVFLYAGIIAVFHSYALYRQSVRFQGHGAKRETIWDHSFMFLPIVVWAVIFLGISIWSFVWR
jgi:hypothetical protein